MPKRGDLKVPSFVRGTRCFAAAIAICSALALGPTAALASPKPFSIDSQDAPHSLLEFGRQSALQIIFASEKVKGIVTNAVHGNYEPIDALNLLLKGTPLVVSQKPDGVLVVAPQIKARESSNASPVSANESGNSARLAQANTTTPGNAATTDNQNVPGKDSKSSGSKDAEKSGLEEIVVTGTNIPGGESASPVLVFTEEDIAKTGAATAQEFLATLPQNFGGGQTDLNHFVPGYNSEDFSYGSAVNLRGLGSDSTLVLINGHRSALAGTAEYTDISAIPMSAVERIEVLTDGASAIYGSDAIGGVVNFILRKNYEGADTRVQGATTTQGGGTEYQVAQDFGTKWDSGSALLSYEFTRREPINSTQREFSSRFGPTNYTQTDFNLDADQDTQNVYLSAQQKLGERTTVSVDFLFSNRDATFQNYDQYASDYSENYSRNQQFGGSVDLTFQVNDSWQMDLTGGASRNKNNWVNTDPGAFNPLGNGVEQIGHDRYDIGYVDAKAAGTILDLPTGPVKLAVGAGYRKESYAFGTGLTGSPLSTIPDSAFNVQAEYTELLIPLIGGTQSRPATSRLLLTLAARHEDYSNFGSTTNPKVGVRWAPLESVKFRGTYGTSFKAPSLYQTSTFTDYAFISNAALPGGQTERYINTTGSNPDLKQQTAKTWTFGVDFSPELIRGLKGELTYYNIVYKGQIESATDNPTAWLTDPAYAGIRTVRGSIPDSEFNALLAPLLSGKSIPVYGCATGTYGYVPCTEPAQDISAIVDDQLLNLAGSRTSGMDLTVDQRVETGVGVVNLDLNTNYAFTLKRQFTVDAPFADLLNTAFNPVRLRVRGSATWSVGPWDITGVTNFTNKYTNDVAVPVSSIASWTTVDVNIRYGFGSRPSTSAPATTSVTLHVANVFDKDPPYLLDPNFPNLGYDPANANPYGRAISVIFAHKW
jgi:iron complex outermembrane receptor protein